MTNSDQAWTEDARERLRAAAKAWGKQKDLAIASGVPLPTLQNMLSSSGGDPGISKVAKVTATLGLSLDYVLTGKGRPRYVAESEEEMIGLPMLGARLSAGPGAWAGSDVGHQADWMFSRDWILKSFGGEKGLCLHLVEGDSMEPDLGDGDWVMLNLNRREGDGIFAVRLDDELLVKRVQREGRYVRLISSNPSYPPILFDHEDAGRTLEILGRVVWNSRLHS